PRQRERADDKAQQSRRCHHIFGPEHDPSPNSSLSVLISFCSSVVKNEKGMTDLRPKRVAERAARRQARSARNRRKNLSSPDILLETNRNPARYARCPRGDLRRVRIPNGQGSIA